MLTGRTPSTPSRSGGGIFSRLRRVLSSAF